MMNAAVKSETFPQWHSRGEEAVRLTPEFIVVGAAARLPAAMSRFTQVTWTVVHSRTVLRMLHHLEDEAQHHNVTMVEILSLQQVSASLKDTPLVNIHINLWSETGDTASIFLWASVITWISKLNLPRRYSYISPCSWSSGTGGSIYIPVVHYEWSTLPHSPIRTAPISMLKTSSKWPVNLCWLSLGGDWNAQIQQLWKSFSSGIGGLLMESASGLQGAQKDIKLIILDQ